MLAILDYKAGNQTSVLRGLAAQGIDAVITADPAILSSAQGIIFPGVGAAKQAMDLLTGTGLHTVLTKLVQQGKPLLGVCLGCQILLEHSEENNTATLGILPGRSVHFDPGLTDENGESIRIPHMGWNSLQLHQPCCLFTDIEKDAEYYFVHSYYTQPAPELVIATTHHGLDFCSVYGKEGLWAVQFHPEKSGPAGLRLLRNFNEYCIAKAASC